MKSLPVKKRGRPLLLDDDVKSYVKAVREASGVITTSITITAATARQIEICSLKMGGPLL